jgi:hypothetical protein
MMGWRFVFVLLLALGPFHGHAQQGTSAGAPDEQRRLDALRQELNRQSQEEESDCRHRFAVNDCLKIVQTRQRAKLADIKRQEAGLHDLQRRQRAEEQSQQAVERSRAREQQLQEQSVTADRSSRGDRPQKNAAGSAASSGVLENTSRLAVQEPSSEVREAHARKLREAEDRRAARDKRVKEKAADKQSVPLPTAP